jgi:hypothetical protein
MNTVTRINNAAFEAHITRGRESRHTHPMSLVNLATGCGGRKIGLRGGIVGLGWLNLLGAGGGQVRPDDAFVVIYGLPGYSASQ